MKITRRDVLKFAIGSAAGIVVTPVPWKLLDDSAIWTQNWPWIPTPMKGNPCTRFTTCTLCPAACGVKARCVGTQPVALSGISVHPLSHGVLCPIGLGGHHLPYHPARVTQPLKLNRNGNTLETLPVSLDEATGALSAVIAEIRGSGNGDAVAVLDQRPGRTMSFLYRQFLAGMPNGMYLNPPTSESGMFDTTGKPFGFDLENTRTMLSFGLPIYDGWSTPGREMQLLNRRTDQKNGFTLIQIESRYSRTASLANQWIAIRPGGETALALAIANVLLDEHLVGVPSLSGATAAYITLVRQTSPESVSEHTGVKASTVRALASEISRRSPALVIGGGDAASGPLPEEAITAIAGLNYLLGNYGRQGGIVPRNDIPDGLPAMKPVPASDIALVPDHSIRLLIIDGEESGNAFPWRLVEKKLAGDRAMVVSLSPFLAGIAQHAHYIVPSPAYLESYQDVPAPSDAAVASFSLAVPFLPAPPEATDPAEFVRRVAVASGAGMQPDPGSIEQQMKRRAEAIFKAGRGDVFSVSTGATNPLKSMTSADQFWTTLTEGACWKDMPTSQAPDRIFPALQLSTGRVERLRLFAEAAVRPSTTQSGVYPLMAIPFGWRSATDESRLTPLMTKLYQESGLRQTCNEAVMHPDTAKEAGISSGNKAVVETPAGSLSVTLTLDAAAMPGVVYVSVGPKGFVTGNSGGSGETLLSICDLHDDGTWRLTNAKVSEA